jgi:hypothetical protein
LVFVLHDSHGALSAKIVFLSQMQGPNAYELDEHQNKQRKKMEKKNHMNKIDGVYR